MTEIDETQVKSEVLELIEKASLERLQTIQVLLEMTEERSVSYGEAFSLLSESDYNMGTLKIAIARVKDEQGLQIVRTRTTTRVFRYLIDEDDPDAGYRYRGFYVNMITPEQKVAISVSTVGRLQSFIGKQNITEEELKKHPEKMIGFLQSEGFISLMSEPNKKIREIVIANMVEIQVNHDGKAVKPIVKTSDILLEGDSVPDIPEFVLLQLEDDLRLLLEQQSVLTKNLPMTDMFAL